MNSRIALLLTWTALSACSEDDNPGSGTTHGNTTDTIWQVSTHPCVGNRTDALLMDSADVGFVGCGSTTTGLGLFETQDGGQSWAAVTTDPAGVFDSFRVLQLSRSTDDKRARVDQPHRSDWMTGAPLLAGRDSVPPHTARDTRAPLPAPLDERRAPPALSVPSNGTGDDPDLMGANKLYVAGISTSSSARVISATGSSGATLTLDEVFAAGDQTWNSFTAGSFARTSSGFSVVESYTGTGVVFRNIDDEDWQDGAGWWKADTSFGFQILDMAVNPADKGGGIYACGSTISQPPVVFLPTADGFGWTSVQLATGLDEYAGELWGIDASSAGLVVGGVNQDRDVGMIYVSGSDMADASTWTALDLSSLYPDDPTWIRGVCRTDSTIVAVGELSMKSQGIVLRSDDGGATWIDQSAALTVAHGAELPALHRCVILDGERVAVAGADGFFALSGQS